MSRFARRLIAAMLFGVVVYGFFVVYFGLRNIQASLATYRWATFALALGLACTNYLLRFLKWQYYLARLSIKGVKPLDSLLVYLSGFILTVTPGKVGEVFKSAVLAKTHGIPAARTAPIVIADRLTDAIGVIVLIVLGSAALSGGLPWAIAGLAAVLFGMVLIMWPTPGLALARYLEGGPARLRPLAPKLREALSSLRVVAAPAALIWPTLLSIVAWGLEGVALFVILGGFGASVPLENSVFFYSVATLAGALVPVPGGLGVAEALIQQQLCVIGGVDEGAATASMILVRFATLWWGVLVGFLALFSLRMRYPAELRESPTATLEATRSESAS